jgi:outer membrane receptor for Fe3+-dicitrate
LRLLILKHVRNLSYEALEREVRANLAYRDFTRVYGVERGAFLCTVAIGVKNMFDVTYFPTALSAGGYVGEPRTFFLEANYHR